MDETINVHRSIAGEFVIFTIVTASYFETRIFVKDAESEEVPTVLLDKVEGHISRVLAGRAEVERYGVSDMAIRTDSFERARDAHDITTANTTAFTREYDRVVTYVKRVEED